jgi:hypothetical protein
MVSKRPIKTGVNRRRLIRGLIGIEIPKPASTSDYKITDSLDKIAIPEYSQHIKP